MGRTLFVEYEKYILSSEWALKRRQYWERYGEHCKACGHRFSLHVHHHTYVRLGDEKLTDLLGLCAPCHAIVHEVHAELGKKKHSLTLVTMMVTGVDLWVAKPRTPKKTKTKRPAPDKIEVPPAKRKIAIPPTKPLGKRKKQRPEPYTLHKATSLDSILYGRRPRRVDNGL